MTRAFLFVVAVLLTGCANWDARVARMQTQFTGKHLDEAIRYFGVPAGRVALSDGGEVVEFRTTVPGNYLCIDEFTTDARGIIVRTRHGGQNGCAISEL